MVESVFSSKNLRKDEKMLKLRKEIKADRAFFLVKEEKEKRITNKSLMIPTSFF